MGSPHSFKKSTSAIGTKIRQGLEVAGTLKGMYDIGSTLYKGARIAAPLISGLFYNYIEASILKDVRF